MASLCGKKVRKWAAAGLPKRRFDYSTNDSGIHLGWNENTTRHFSIPALRIAPVLSTPSVQEELEREWNREKVRLIVGSHPPNGLQADANSSSTAAPYEIITMAAMEKDKFRLKTKVILWPLTPQGV